MRHSHQKNYSTALRKLTTSAISSVFRDKFIRLKEDIIPADYILKNFQLFTPNSLTPTSMVLEILFFFLVLQLIVFYKITSYEAVYL